MRSVMKLTGQLPGCPVLRVPCMSIQQLPILTTSLLVTITGLFFLIPDPTRLYFHAGHITTGESWRIISGHFMHSDPSHLFWNGLGLAVLGTLIELRSRSLFWLVLTAGIASVSLLLLSPFAQLQYYCGLSGVLNTFLLVAIWLEWKATRSWLVAAVACGSLAKVVAEVSLDVSLLTHMSWPPYAWSHAAGLLGGLTVVLWTE